MAKGQEFFFERDGKRQDAELHNAILDDGDHTAAAAIGRAVAIRLGLSPARANALMGTGKGFRRAITRFDPSEPRDEYGRWTDGGSSDAPPTSFVSPNIGHMTLQEATASLKGERQKRLAAASRYIDAKLGLKDAYNVNVIGAWADGAENSMMVTMPGASPALARVSAAMKGHIADQKSVLVFQPHAAGAQFMAQFRAKGSVDEIHAQLLSNGLAFHTLEPTSNGATVHVFGSDQETLDAIGKAAEHYGNKAKLTAGNGEFIGTKLETGTDREQRDDARAVYEAVIREESQASGGLPGRDIAGAWKDVRSHWADLGADAGNAERPDDGGAARGSGRATSPEQAQRAAEKAAAGESGLAGLPTKPIQISDQWYVPGPFAKARQAAERYMHDAGLAYEPPQQYLKVDKARATRIATEFDKMKHDPDDPRVKAAYEALARETLAQWQVIKATGLKVEWIKPGQPDPYRESLRLAAVDVTQNNHWWGFSTDLGFGSGEEETRHNNPMLQMTDEVIDGRKCVVNDIFRIVHDYFGHFKEGVGFRADGEENAWRSHSAMFSDLARGAMTSETRGQNSWLNFGPYGDSNRTASVDATHYAPQRVGLMPDWTWNDGRADPERRGFHPLRAFDPGEPRDEQGRWTDGGGGGGSPVAAPKPAESADEKFLRGIATRWAEDGDWNDLQHAARYVISGEKIDDYVCYDCGGDDRQRFLDAKGTLDEINRSAVPKRLYRGLINASYKVGDTFSESLASWTGKKELAEDFASGVYSSSGRKPDEKTVLDLVSSGNSKGFNISDRLSSDASENLRTADEWLTSGEYRVEKIAERNGIKEVTVRRIGPARSGNVQRAFDPGEPRDEQGRWTEGGGGASHESDEDREAYATERLITDGPREGYSRVGIVKDKYSGFWGGSHSGSAAITGYSAKVMGIDGYRDLSPVETAERLGEKFLAAIRDSRGSPEPLYHGFHNTEGVAWKEGDTVKLPLLAATGDASNAYGYGIHYTRTDEGNADATAFEFPAGTKFAGYARWDREQAKDFGYQWDEAIVAGEFKVVGTRIEHEPGYRSLPIKVVRLEPVAVFNPDDKSWHNA